MSAQRIFMLGATGTIGQATVRALLKRGHEVVCFVRPRSGVGARMDALACERLLPGAQLRFGEVCDAASLAQEGFRGERFDAWVSCLASRSGTPADAWAIDHRAHVQALAEAQRAGVKKVVLLSAICVQKPQLAFQQAKLRFEQALIKSDLDYSIVRPTAFFKSLSGQVERVRRGQPYLLFGDGALTACKPISDTDLADYLADCIDLRERSRRILPIGGPGPALTPRQQGELLFAAFGLTPKFRRVPVALMDAIIGVLATLGHALPSLAAKAELARIGRYYATESMLVLNPGTGRYDAAATPSTGTQTLGAFFADLARGAVALPERGDHAVF